MANRIPEMPQDLQDHIAAHPDLRLPAGEQPQHDLVSEKIWTGSYYSTVFFPVSTGGEIFVRPANTPMIVSLVIPGGFDEVNSGDQNLCIYLAKKTGGIFVAGGHPSGIKNGIEFMKAHCRSVLRTLLYDCDVTWRPGWGTDARNVTIVSSSLATVLAIDLVQMFSVLALGLIVPLFDTNPGSRQDPWGENGDVPGLDTHYLSSSLDETYKGVSRDDWHNNPSKMPDFDRMNLPPMCIILAEFDPLYPSGKEFADSQTVLAEHNVCYKVFRSVHQVKDLHQDTAEGSNSREYLVECFFHLLASGNSRWPHWSWQQGLLR